VAEETSRFGTFSVAADKDACVVTFQPSKGSARRLFRVESCTVEPSLSSLNALEKLGEKSLPFTSSSGVEYHVFSTLTARGGNACDGYDYYFVTLKDGVSWATPKSLGGCTTLEQLKTPDKTGATVSFIAPATTTSDGLQLDVKHGQARPIKLPRLARSVVKTETVTLKGSYGSGMGATNFLPYVETAAGMAIIDQAGSCKLDAVEDGATVELVAVRKQLSDKQVEHTCQSVKVQK
jgi:hypothetical protein